MALISDNAYAQALREPRVKLPPFSVHNFNQFKRMEASMRQSVLDASFRSRTQPGMSSEDRFDAMQGLMRISRQLQSGLGRVAEAEA